MPYISLYRKYRSQTFDDVVGQDHVVRTITNAIKAGRIGQGYLFCGSRGTGKTTVARLIAKALNCETGATATPCNVCDACVSITAGNAVDVIEMDAASNRGVDDVDALRDGVKYPPMRLRWKVYIIDEAHQLSPQAKDAFLKTLEEPPPHAVFILATTEAHKIPVTIRSRCQQFDFRRGTVGEIADRLRYVAESENVKADDDAIQLLARSANGSYRDSLSLLEQVMAYTESAITAKDVYTVLGMVDEDVLLELGVVLASDDTSAAFTLADRLLREGRDVRELLKSAANHFRDLLALKVGAEKLHIADERWRNQAETYTQERLVRIIDVISAAEKDLRWNEQHRLGLEMTLLKAMIRPKVAPLAVEAPAVSVATPPPAPPRPPSQAPKPVVEEEPEPVPVTQAVSREEDSPAPEALETVEAAEEPVAPAQTGDKAPTLAQVQQNWPKALMHVQKILKQPQVAAMGRGGKPIDISGSVLTVGFTKTYEMHRQVTQTNASFIAKAFEDVMQVKLKVKTATIADDTASERTAAAPLETVKTEPVQHPLTNDILTMFDGTIVEADQDPWEDSK